MQSKSPQRPAAAQAEPRAARPAPRQASAAPRRSERPSVRHVAVLGYN